MFTRMTATARGVGLKNALVCGAVFLGVWCALAAAIVLSTGQPISKAFDRAFLLLWSLFLLHLAVVWLHRRRMGGRVLLDRGPSPVRDLFLLTALLQISVFMSDDGPAWEVSFAVFWLLMAFGRLQVRENGLWEYGGLLKWSRVASYRWAEDGTLLAKVKGFLAIPRGVLPVPPEKKEAVNALLLEYAPARAREP